MQRVHPVYFVAVVCACGPIVPVLGDGDDDDGGGSTSAADDGRGSDTPGGGGDDPSAPGDGAGDGGDGDGGDPSAPGDGGDTGPVGSCGDGIVEGAEICDDGNRTPGDGCEADCTASPGQLLWSQTIDGDAEDDSARAVAVTASNGILVAGSLELGGGDDVWLRVLTSDGTTIDDDTIDLGDDELGTSVAITPDGIAFVAGVQPGEDRAVLVRRENDALVDHGGAPVDITAFSAIASPTSTGFVLVTHAGNFDALAATVRRYDSAGEVLGDIVQPTGLFVGAAVPSADGGTILGGGSFGGGNGGASSVWLAELTADGSAGWSSSMEADPDISLRIRGLAIAGDGRIVGVGTQGSGGPMNGDNAGWIWWWSAAGMPEGDGPLDIGGAAARPSSVVVGTHGLVVGGTTVALDDGFVAGLSTDGELQWGYQLAGDLGLEDRVNALVRVPGVGVAAVGVVTQIGTGEDAWVGMFTE